MPYKILLEGNLTVICETTTELAAAVAVLRRPTTAAALEAVPTPRQGCWPKGRPRGRPRKAPNQPHVEGVTPVGSSLCNNVASPLERLLASIPTGTRVALKALVAAGPDGITAADWMRQLGRSGQSSGATINIIKEWAEWLGIPSEDVITTETRHQLRRRYCYVRSPLAAAPTNNHDPSEPDEPHP